MYNRIQIPLLSLADICREICELTGGKIIEHEGRYTTYSYPGFLYSRNFILDAAESEIEPIIKEIKENMSKGLPRGISFTKECVPDDIEEILGKYGFQPFISQTGMIFDLDHPFSDARDENIAIMTAEQMPAWSKAVAEGFPKPFEDTPFLALNTSDKAITYGYMDGETILSTGMLMIDPELSGIHEISTQNEHRGKGQATAIILRMLQDLKERGIRSVSLPASDLGRDYVYTPLGFETVSVIPTWNPPM